VDEKNQDLDCLLGQRTASEVIAEQKKKPLPKERPGVASGLVKACVLLADAETGEDTPQQVI
jgi:hypothetical protein